MVWLGRSGCRTVIGSCGVVLQSLLYRMMLMILLLAMSLIPSTPYDAMEAVVQTDYDGDGVLCWGVCGSKMAPSKKDSVRGRTVQAKLHLHMRKLHGQ